MSISFEATIPLPPSDACAAWSAEARVALSEGRRSFDDLQRDAALALQKFYAATGEDAACWFSVQPWTDKEELPASLITLYFGTDGAVSRDQLLVFGEPLRAWTSTGIHPLPDDAFPSLAMHGGKLYQLWVNVGDHARRLIVRPRGPRRTRLVDQGAHEAPAKELLDFVLHGLVSQHSTRSDEETEQRNQLKLAFALTIARRIVEADGVVQDTERTWLENAFPAEVIEKHWLDDEALLQNTYQTAREQLPSLLGYHEKLAMLSTFFAASYSDGNVEVRELKVLKQASEVLGLDKRDVVGFLQKLW